MAIRAYKLAEELGIERGEFVDKARELGVELKSAMATLGEAEVALLRERLGAKKGVVTERRVEGGAGSAVIRRRRAAPRPAPEPEPAPPPLATPATPEPLAAAPAAAAPPPEPEAVPEPEPEPEPARPLPGPAVPEVRAERPAPRTAPVPPSEAGPADRKGRQRKRVREVVNLREQEQLARQVTSRAPVRRAVSVDPRAFQSPRRRRRDAPVRRPAAPAASPPKPTKRVVRIDGTISVAELARQLGAKSAEVQGRLMALGTLVTVNQGLDPETAGRVAAEYGYEVQEVGFREEEVLATPAEARDEANLRPRPPVVTVMGHVDHGKTSLLDAIRKTNVVADEAGGITQHIGAYQARVGDRTLTFIDTPGHAAFTEMRARGAQVTDLVILVVAANDSIMPQTVEAIDHARAARVPIVVAVNKTDLPEARPAQVRQRLMEHGLVPEEFGGDTLCVDVSATKGTGLEQLLEAVGLQADLLELRADPSLRARGVVLEAHLDKGRGPVATVLVQEGTLCRGDAAVAGTAYGRVRAMLDENGDPVKEALPSRPVQVIGLSAVPEAGNSFHAVENERVAKQIAEHRAQEGRRPAPEVRARLSLDEVFARAQGGTGHELAVVLKADTQGSVEVVRDTLQKLSTDAVRLNVIHAGVGAVTESDVMLARASDAVVVGFHVRPEASARREAEAQGVELRLYQVIYDVVDEVRKAMAGLLPPTVSEKVLGQAEVRRIFNVPRVGTVAGCFVTEGQIRRSSSCRLVRDGVQVHQGRFGSLKRFKDDVREVQKGFECGIAIEAFNDVKVGDVIESFELEEKPAEL
jgi:translation initiation factor IF-2